MTPQETPTTNEKVNILVVDDVPDKLVSMEVILQTLGENIVSVQSGRDALRQLLEREFAVILLDVNMPDLDGFETASLIRQRKRSETTPIIFITAFSDDTHALQGYSLGAVDYILAPVVPDVLRTKVSVFVDLFRKNEQIKKQAEHRVALIQEQAARVAAEEATRRSMFLAEASQLLSKSLDYEATIKTLMELTAPGFADAVAVGICNRYDAQGPEEFTVHSSAKAPQSSFAWAQLPERLVHASRRALDQTRTQQVTNSVVEDAGVSSDPNLQVWASARSIAVVPLLARGRTLGVYCLARSHERGPFDKADLALAEDLAIRAAIAIDNARLYREIQDGDRRKDEFLAMLGHELRNPLAAIANALDCLRLTDKDEEIFTGAQDVLDRQVQQMSRLVDDLLDVSRITRGKVELRKEPIKLGSAVDRAVATVQPTVLARRHELSVTLPEEDVLLEADPVRLEQILANLLNNAAKYTEPGGQIWLTGLCEGDHVVLRVRDTGMGIPPHLLPKVFDLFTQGDRSLDRSQGGLGIGLTLVKSLVAMHGGQVQAYSAGPQQGSEFVVRLPCMERAVEPPPPPIAEFAAVTNGSSRRILLVDDNADLTKTMATLLERVGHVVRTAGDGPSAIDAAVDFQPQVVLIDIGLPGMNGLEVATFLRQRLAMNDAYLVAMTGYGQSEDRRRSREAGFDHHLVKPVPLGTIQDLLAQLSTERRVGDHAPAAAAPTELSC